MSYTNNPKTVSIIVITYNSSETINYCLKNLVSELNTVDGEIIVFDNNSIDSTIKHIHSEFPDIYIMQSEKNMGFAAANNMAVQKASGKYLLFANPDMAVDLGAVQGMINEAENKVAVGAITARLRNRDGSFQPNCRNYPTMQNIFFSRGSVLKTMGSSRKNIKESYTLGDFDRTTEVPAASATCFLIEKDFFRKIGGFDERFFLFMEDTDLCLRINQCHRKIYFVPEAGAVHLWGKGSAISPIKRMARHHISVWKYFLKYFPNGFSLFVLPLGLVVNFIIKVLTGYRETKKAVRREIL